MSTKFGTQQDRMTDAEKEQILYARNSRNTLRNGQVVLGDRSKTYGLTFNVWGKGVLPDAAFIRNRIQTYFVNLFKWKGKDATEEFVMRMEHILFQHGKVAIVKMPNGEFYPVQYNWNEEDEDFYGNPKKITIITNNKFNGKVFFEKNFVLINNKSGQEYEPLGTLDYAFERLRQINRAIIDVDNASLISRPKWGANISADDEAITDIENAMNSNRAIIPTGNIDFRDGGLEELSGTDSTDSRINIYQFQLNNLLQLLGLSVNEGNVKAERMSELEVAKGDKFANGDINKLIQDMYDRRLAALDKLKELGIDLTLEEQEVETMDEEDVNGELNKNKVGDNNEKIN